MGRKSAHLKLGTGQKRLGEEKEGAVKGIPFDFKSLGSYYCAASYCLWLERFSIACTQSLSSTLMASIIGTVFFPLTGVAAAVATAAAIDNLTEIPKGPETELLKLNFQQIHEGRLAKIGQRPLDFQPVRLLSGCCTTDVGQ